MTTTPKVPICGDPRPPDEPFGLSRACIRSDGHPFKHRDEYGHVWGDLCGARTPSTPDEMMQLCTLLKGHNDVNHKTSGGWMWLRSVSTDPTEQSEPEPCLEPAPKDWPIDRTSSCYLEKGHPRAAHLNGQGWSWTSVKEPAGASPLTPYGEDLLAEVIEADSIWAARAEYLYALIDDIDTAADMAKGDDGLYRALVSELQYQRFQVATVMGDDSLNWIIPPPEDWDSELIGAIRDTYLANRPEPVPDMSGMPYSMVKDYWEGGSAAPVHLTANLPSPEKCEEKVQGRACGRPKDHKGWHWESRTLGDAPVVPVDEAAPHPAGPVQQISTIGAMRLVDSARRDLDAAERQIKESQKHTAKLNAHISDLYVQAKEQVDQLRQSEQKVAAQAAEYKALRADWETMKRRVEGAEATSTQRQKEIHSLLLRVGRAEGDNAIKTEQHLKDQERINTLAGLRDDMARQRDGLQGVVTYLQNQLAKVNDPTYPSPT